MNRILVVDDEHISASTIGALLREEGYAVEVANNGKEALERAAQFRPDLLISDWKLKDELDGIEVVRGLQAENPQLKAILYSGLGIEDLKRHSKGTRVSHYLEKPCGLLELLEAVTDALRRPDS